MMEYVHHLSEGIGSLPLQLRIPLLLSLLPAAVVTLFVSNLIVRAIGRMISVNILYNEEYSHLPRPKHEYWTFPLYGDLGSIQKAKPAEAHISWTRELGNVYVYRGILYSPRLMLADARAMNYILGQGQSYDYCKPEQTRKFLVELLGNGLLVAEGDIHKRQRKILQPAFSVSAIRDLTPRFFKHANNFAEVVGKMVDATKGPSDIPFIAGQSIPSAKESAKGKPVFDVSYWLSKVTLDIIGDAGFDYQFDAVNAREGDGDALSEAFAKMMRESVALSPLMFLQLVLQNIPGLMWMRLIPTKRRTTMISTHAILQSTSQNIIKRKRKEIQEEIKGQSLSLQDEKSFFEDGSKSKDLLYLMMKANMAKDVRMTEKLDDAELLGQMTTLLLAGHETTGTLTTWLLKVISEPEHQHIQEKLRSEIEDTMAGRDEIDYDTLMAMPYMDNVTKEILRVMSPVTSTVRHASKDDVIPLSKEYKTRDGKSTFNSVIVKKGQELIIPIQVINRLEDIWGPTADQFDPDRWNNIPQSAKNTGMPSQVLTFLEGPRGCIGNRFAVAEFKAILSALLRSLRFEAVGWEVEPKQGIVVRPRIVGQEELGMQMPIRVSRI